MSTQRIATKIVAFCLTAVLCLDFPGRTLAATWTQLVNPAPGGAGVMLQLADGTVMIQNGSSQNWMRLTPDVHGSYINGVWTLNPIRPMSFPRLYFTSHVLQDGRVWVLGGEYTGPFLDSNIAPSAEIWDPLTNEWATVAPYPNQPGGCSRRTVTSNANVTALSNVITGIYSTDRFQVGWTVAGSGIPAGATVTSVDSSSQVHISQNAMASISNVILTFNGIAAACFGDDPSILIPGGKILAGNIFNRSTYVYSIATDSWSFAANKFYNDRSDEEGWTTLPGSTVLTYDLFQSVSAGTGYAELYNPGSGLWTGISPADGTAHGTLPVLSSSALGFELGPVLRLQDGRVFVIGANNHTALYTPSTNTWAAGPDIMGILNNTFGAISPAAFGADDAPAALMPNGHVLLAADAGPNPVITSGNTTAGSNIITNIASTAGLQVGWTIAQTSGPPSVGSGTRITSVDSPMQIHVSNNASTTSTGIGLTFGGLFSRPTQIFDFNPDDGTISPVSPANPDLMLAIIPSYVTRMLVLPTGQVLFSDSTNRLWVYTSDGVPNPSLRPVVNNVTYNGSGLFTLTGKQLNGQSNGSAYGDDVQSDENYPIVRLVSPAGNVYYCRTTNWSSTGVGSDSMLETVNFTLNTSVTAGNYVLIVSGAGISSFPLAVNITQEEVNGQ